MYRKHEDSLPASRRAENAVAFIRKPTVCARVAMSHTELYRRIRAGKFPAPVKLGKRASAWVAVEIDGWIADRVAERDARQGEA